MGLGFELKDNTAARRTLEPGTERRNVEFARRRGREHDSALKLACNWGGEKIAAPQFCAKRVTAIQSAACDLDAVADSAPLS
jgi:hypothetical protein